MVFVADDLGAWLVGLLADRARRRLTSVVLGSDHERALRSAATAAVRVTAEELRPDDDEQAAQLAMVISEVFAAPVPDAPLSGQATLLEGLQAGIAGQMAVLDDAGLTGMGQSSADVLGVPAAVLTEKLSSHLLREIVIRGSRGGPLFPLASQLNDDVTHLQGQQIQGALRQLSNEIPEALARLDAARTAAPPMISESSRQTAVGTHIAQASGSSTAISAQQLVFVLGDELPQAAKVDLIKHLVAAVGDLSRTVIVDQTGNLIGQGHRYVSVENSTLRDALASTARRGPVVPLQLPIDVVDFTNRDTELNALDRLVCDQPGTACLYGMGGVGKSSVATRFAHTRQQLFSDGILWADLRHQETASSWTCLHTVMAQIWQQ